jgi:hypothetical protein
MPETPLPQLATQPRVSPVVSESALAALRLAAITLVAIGVSGILAFGLGVVEGRAFVAGSAPGVTYSAQSCREFIEEAPHARTCAEAAAKEHFAGVIWHRIAAGAVVAVLLAVATGLRRRRRNGPTATLPDALVPAIATATFAVAGVWIGARGVDLALRSADSGAGGLLSVGVVALALAAWFAVDMIKAITKQPFATAR